MQIVPVDPKSLSVTDPLPYFSPPKISKFKLPDFSQAPPSSVFKHFFKHIEIVSTLPKFDFHPITELITIEDKADDLIQLSGWGDIMLSILETDDIIITRPLNELFCHVKNLKLPSLQLIARVIKTLALSIFRWHLCDECLLKKGDHVTDSLDGHLSVSGLADFQSKHPFLLNSAYVLILKSGISKKDDTDFDKDSLTPDAIRDYFYDCYKLEITDKVQGNSINDLFKSMQFDLKYGQDIFG